MRILIVDDAAVERAIFARIAHDLGHEIVAEAADLATASRLAADLRPQLIVLDGRLPPTGAPAAVAALLAAAPDAAVAVVAALEELDLVRAARAAGAAVALRRPFLPTQVAAALRDLAR
jgi:response regulator NasT